MLDYNILSSGYMPAQVSYESFWLHYFFKVQLLQEVCYTSLHHSLREGGPLIAKCSLQEEERRAELMARAKRKEEPWKWDEDAEEGKSIS